MRASRWSAGPARGQRSSVKGGEIFDLGSCRRGAAPLHGPPDSPSTHPALTCRVFSSRRIAMRVGGIRAGAAARTEGATEASATDAHGPGRPFAEHSCASRRFSCARQKRASLACNRSTALVGASTWQILTALEIPLRFCPPMSSKSKNPRTRLRRAPLTMI